MSSLCSSSSACGERHRAASGAAVEGGIDQLLDLGSAAKRRFAVEAAEQGIDETARIAPDRRRGARLPGIAVDILAEAHRERRFARPGFDLDPAGCARQGQQRSLAWPVA